MPDFEIVNKIGRYGKTQYPIKNRLVSLIDFNNRILDMAHRAENVIDSLNYLSITSSNVDELLTVRIPQRNDETQLQMMRLLQEIYYRIDDIYNRNIDSTLFTKTNISGNVIDKYDIIGTTKFESGFIYYVYHLNNEFHFYKLNNAIVRLAVDKSIGLVYMVDYLDKTFNPDNDINFTSFLIRPIREATSSYDYTEDKKEDVIRKIEDVVLDNKYGSWFVVQTTCKNDKLLEEFLYRNRINPEFIMLVSDKAILINALSKDFVHISKTKKSKSSGRYIHNEYEELLLDKDVVYHTPYDSYEHVLDMIDEMCHNDIINSIYISLYRVKKNGKIINSLIDAATSGKEVYINIELNARGNEEINIYLVKYLEGLGIPTLHISCNYYNYKIHGKIFCAVSDNGTIYSHISTGNYNEDTVGIYTDIQYLTSNNKIGLQILQVFKAIFDKTLVEKLNDSDNLFISPYNMRDEIIRLIRREASKGKDGRINIKCNALCDLKIIQLLYDASKDGVKINILCRGACSILPLNKNIVIRSKLSKYLEHDRIYMFGDDIYVGSADLLLRNLNKRIETLIKVDDSLKDQVSNIFYTNWEDLNNLWFINHKLEWVKY